MFWEGARRQKFDFKLFGEARYSELLLTDLVFEL